MRKKNIKRFIKPLSVERKASTKCMHYALLVLSSSRLCTKFAKPTRLERGAISDIHNSHDRRAAASRQVVERISSPVHRSFILISFFFGLRLLRRQNCCPDENRLPNQCCCSLDRGTKCAASCKNDITTTKATTIKNAPYLFQIRSPVNWSKIISHEIRCRRSRMMPGEATVQSGSQGIFCFLVLLTQYHTHASRISTGMFLASALLTMGFF